MKDSVSYLRKSDLENCKRCFFVFGNRTKKYIKKITKDTANGSLVVFIQNAIDYSDKVIRSLEAEGVTFRVFTLQAFPFHVRSKADKRSQLVLEDIYEVMEGKGKIPSRMLNKLYDDVQVCLAYKKFVIENIKSLLVIDEAVGHLLRKKCSVYVHVDSRTREILSWEGRTNLVFSNFRNKNIRVSYSSFHYLESILRKLLLFSKIIILPIFVISRIKKLELNSPKKRKEG